MIFEEWWKQTKPAECDELKDYFIEAWNTSAAQYTDDLDRLVAIAVAAERDAFDRRLALQKASWERELALDVEAERKICERLVFAALYGWGNARELAVAAIRLRSNVRGNRHFAVGRVWAKMKCSPNLARRKVSG